MRENPAERPTPIVDVERIIKAKAGRKARYVPRFAISWLKHILHQNEVNRFLTASSNKTGVEWLEECVRYLDMNLVVEGREHLPDPADGKLYTFVSNHPLGGEDGVALGAILGRHYEGRVKYLVNDILTLLPGLKPLCIPINKTGAQSKQFPALVEAGFASENHIIMFPAGLCSRRIKGRIHDLPWKKTFVQKSVETHRDVVPIHFDGRNSDRFYRIANLCKAVGLKFNVAMLFLVDEMYRNAHKTFHVRIGQPIPWQTFDRSRRPAEWAVWVEEQVYNL